MKLYFSFKDGAKAEDQPGEASESESERVYSQDCSFENRTYRVGDFVYVEPSEPNLKPHIVCIERLWEDEAGYQIITFLATFFIHINQLDTNQISVYMYETANVRCDLSQAQH